jgi:preprotein translocase subunit Sec63
MTIKPARRADGFKQSDKQAFTPEPGDSGVLRSFKWEARANLGFYLSGGQSMEKTVGALCDMAMTIGQYARPSESYLHPTALSLIEPILNLVQTQYGSTNRNVSDTARRKVNEAMHYRGVASNVSGATLVDCDFLNVVNANAQRVLQKRYALRGWIETHKGQPEEIEAVENAIDDKLADFKQQSDEALAKINPDSPDAEIEKLEARDMFTEETRIYDEWKTMLRPPEPVA